MSEPQEFARRLFGERRTEPAEPAQPAASESPEEQAGPAEAQRAEPAEAARAEEAGEDEANVHPTHADLIAAAGHSQARQARDLRFLQELHGWPSDE